MQKEMLHKEKSKKEAELRDLAMKARMEKSGPVGIASRLDAGGETSRGRACRGAGSSPRALA